MAFSYASFNMNSLKDVDMPAEDLVQNKAGGFVHQITDFARFRRFLVLGADANTFYADAKALTLENAKIIVELLKANQGEDMVNEIVTISQAGRAPRQSPGIFALAVILTLAKPAKENEAHPEDTEEQKAFKTGQNKATAKVRKLAMEAIPKVCRTASTLYELMAYYKTLNLDGKPESERGLANWSHSLRKAVGNWYLEKSPIDVAMQVTKYKTRNGISSRDLLRLSHPKPSELGKRKREEDVPDMQLALKFAAHPDDEVVGEGNVAEFLRDVQRLKKEKEVGAVVDILGKHRQMAWEHVGESALLKRPQIWATLLDRGMGLTALIRNLSRFLDIKLFGNAKQWTGGYSASAFEDQETLHALILEENPHMARESKAKEDEAPWQPSKDYLQVVVEKITDKEALSKARVHPLRVLLATATLTQKYLKSTIPPPLLTALDQSFELSFSSAKPTNKKFLLAMDVSGSMSSPCLGTNTLSCREAASAVTMILNRIEPHVKVMAFTNVLSEFPITKTEPLPDILKRTERLPFGGTDCSLPILHAIKQKLDVDVFVVMTDSETWRGKDVAQCLRQYRAMHPEKRGNDAAKLMVCAFSSTGFSIADPQDAGMLDVAGFDSALPEIMEDFVLGGQEASKL